MAHIQKKNDAVYKHHTDPCLSGTPLCSERPYYANP